MVKGANSVCCNRFSIPVLGLTALLCFLFQDFCYGQRETEKGLPFVTNFHPKDYQSYPQSWTAVEDNRGLLYFGNQGYILEYDGVTWKKISVAANGTVAIRSMTINNKGIIYYASISDFGFLSVDSLGQTKANSLLKYVPEEKRKFNDIWTVHAGNDGIYFQARERIFRFTENKTGDGLTGELKTWEPSTKFMFAFYHDGVYYVHQQGLGLYRMINDSLQLIPGSEFLGKERLQVMTPYPTGTSEKKYLLGQFYSGLYMFNGKTFTRFHTDADSLLGATLYKGILLKDGTIALATAGKGLVIINRDGKTMQLINREAGLQDESVYGVYSDSKDNLWLTLDNGISRVQTASPLSQFTIQSGITTAALCVQRFGGSIYLGTTNGLLKFNNIKRRFEVIHDISTNQVFAFWDTGDELLIATDGLYSVKNNKIHLVQPSLSGNLQLATVFGAKKYPNLIFGGDAIQGLAIFDKKKQVDRDQSAWKFSGYLSGIAQQVWTMAEEKDGTLWAGTQNEYVYRLHIVLDQAGNIDYQKSSAEKFGREHGLGVGCGPVYGVKGKAYFSADSSFYVFDRNTNRFVKDSTFGSFPNAGGKDEVYIWEDSVGRAWIRFGKESIVATPQPDGTYKTDRTPLLPIGERTLSQFYPEKNGITWICTTDGLVRYDETLKKNYDQPFKSLLRKIDAGNEFMNPDKVDSVNQATFISYKNNNLRFEYAAPFFEQEEKTKYQTWMEGFDKGWSGWDHNTYKEYTNLSEGKYKFHVRSKNVYQIISEEAVYSFTVTAPWYRSWVAWVLYAILLLAVVYLLVRYRTYKLHAKQKELELKVHERTGEVQQQAEELSTVNQISKALVAQLDLDALIKLVGDQLLKLFKANIVYLALLDQKKKIINFPYQHGDNMPPMKLGDGLTSKIIMTGEPLLINKDVHEKSSQLGIGRIGLPAASYLGVPIPVGEEIIGVLSVQSTEKENRFNEKDQRLLTTIAANVGVALRKAGLFEEVKLAKLEAEAARKTAEQANAAKSAFLSTVSHELRTPLTSVLGFAKIIRKRLEEKIFPITDRSDPKTDKTIAQVSENLNVVISEGERLTHLINDVLDLAKIEAGKMEWNNEPVPVPEIVERAIAATSSLFDQKHLTLDRQIESDLPEITGDRDKLIQVVVNLLSNAVKFTDSGSVTCKVFRREDDIVVGITDTGIGIAPEDHAAVFEQFKQVGDTLTDKPKGTGLGLPICKEIVEHHGGRIWLESDLGKGSTFFFSLPVSKVEDVKPMHFDDLVKQLRVQMAQSPLNIKGQGTNILVVDDEESIRSLLRQELSEAGYTIDEAGNGKEALAKIRKNKPDLIILDVMMPEMNGFEVAAILKNDPQTMDIPIIVLSIVQDKARGFRIGVDRYLTKPINTTELFAEVGTLLEQGKSKKKVMIVDEDSAAVRSLTEVLQAKGYNVVESDGKELVEKAVSTLPDIIILNSLLSDKQQIVQSLRFEKGLENVLFLIYQ